MGEGDGTGRRDGKVRRGGRGSIGLRDWDREREGRGDHKEGGGGLR